MCNCDIETESVMFSNVILRSLLAEVMNARYEFARVKHINRELKISNDVVNDTLLVIKKLIGDWNYKKTITH